MLFRLIRNFGWFLPKALFIFHFWSKTTKKGSTLLDGWVSYFEELSSPTIDPSFDPLVFQSSNLLFQQLLCSPVGERFEFFEEDFQGALKTLRLEKPSSPDSIEPEHLLFTGPLLIKWLAVLFNLPNQLCSSHILPIPKGSNKDLMDPSNDRGITIHSNFAKLFEEAPPCPHG